MLPLKGSACVSPRHVGRHVALPVSAVLLATVVATALAFQGAASAAAAQSPVLLGNAGTFAVLAGSGITNTGPTTVNRDVGSFPTATETGLGSVTFAGGSDQGGDALTQRAKNDLTTAYNDASGRSPATNVPVELGGTTLPAGVYTDTSLGLTGALTLDGQGNPNAEFIFQAGSTLTTASNSRVLLINGASACHVVWQIGSSATFGTGTQFAGDVLAQTSITATTGATFQGRLLAEGGAVTLDTNTITAGDCAAVPSSPVTTTPTTTTTAPVVATTAPAATGVPVATSPTTSGAASTTATIPTAPVTTSLPVATTSTGGRSAPAAVGSAGSPSTTRSGAARTGSSVSTSVPAQDMTSSSRSQLPFTGADSQAEVAIAMTLMLGGGLLLIAGRRNRKA